MSVPLAELQAEMAAAVLSGVRPPELCAQLAGSPIPAVASLRIHRNTVLGALTAALRVSYPTAAQLVGEEFFDQVAVEFATRNPPRSACLGFYGTEFATFLASYAPAKTLPYLGDCARFDHALERLASDPATARTVVVLEGGVTLSLAATLRVFGCDFPVDELRDAIASERLEALSQLDMTPRSRWLALWRDEQDVRSARLDVAPATFLSELLAGRSALAALESAVAGRGLEAVVSTIDSQILRAPFARLDHASSSGVQA